MNIQPLELINYPSAFQLLADSFFDNPAHIYLCSDEAKRKEHLEWLLGKNLVLELNQGAKSFCITENNTTLAMGFWNRPGIDKIGLWDKIAAGLLLIPFKMGVSGFSRVMEVSDSIDRQLTQTMGETDYWYLNNMVVRSDLRGKGMGSQILMNQFEAIRKLDKNAIFALSTQRQITVDFYQRLGFKVILEEKIGKGSLAFTNWIMKKHE